MNIVFYVCRYDLHRDEYIKDENALITWCNYPYCPHKGDYIYVDNIEYAVIKTIMRDNCIEVQIQRTR